MDQAYIASLSRSAASYASTASYWGGRASDAQGTISSLTPQLQHKRDQLAQANAVNGRLPELTDRNAAVGASLSTLSSQLANMMDDSGASAMITDLDNDFSDPISRAGAACSQLIEVLSQEVASLEGQIASAVSLRQAANANASSALASAAWCNRQIADELARG